MIKFAFSYILHMSCVLNWLTVSIYISDRFCKELYSLCMDALLSLISNWSILPVVYCTLVYKDAIVKHRRHNSTVCVWHKLHGRDNYNDSQTVVTRLDKYVL